MNAPTATKPPDAAKFMTTLLQTIRDTTGRRPPPTWTSVDKVQTRLGITNRDALDAGIRLAAAKGWLRVDGDPPQSVTMTVDGIKLIEPPAK